MSFGRKGVGGGNDALAERRAAFLAEERARQHRPAEPVAGPAKTVEPAYVRQKTMGTAYLLWFILGGLAAHRFYLGHSASGIAQAVLVPIGYAFLLSGAAVGIPMIAAGWVWVIVDAFLIPGMLRAANERFRRDAVGEVFA